MLDRMTHYTTWKIEKRRVGDPKPYAIEEFEGNLLLNEGIQNLLDLGITAGGTAWTNANSYIGVGDSSSAEAAAQTGLQATTNKAWAAMESTYPSRASQTLSFRAEFADSVAEFAWEEFTISNSNDDSGQNLNRKVASKGTKTSGEVWTVTCTVTLS